ncbi:transcription factor grauzone-like [Condylostylus longicornis]|uniref:transcription factor grauzone-like n=1 Tax=Condylostylus longicornis TaxID=2530218 RepID=UPI00244DF8D4|nr:transcription factor grauzone-like [Condylostylus longicornis]
MLKMNSSCFMCLNSSDKTLNVFSEGFVFRPIDIIKKHFWFTPTVDNPEICLNCWETTENFHKFYLRVKEVHENMVKCEIYDSELGGDGVLNDEKHQAEDDLPSFNSTDISYNVANIDNGSIIAKSEILDQIADDTLGKVKEEIEVYNEKKLSTNKIPDGRKKSIQLIKKTKKIKVNTAEETEEYDKKVASFVTLSCVICSSTFPTFGKLKTHWKNGHNTNGYAVCCNRRFYKRSLLVDHIDTHINPEHFKCPKCSRTFTNRKTHKDHVDTYHDLSKVKHTCDLCCKEFLSNKTLAAHKKTHRPKEEWKFKCNYIGCDKIYASRPSLNSHIQHVHKVTTKVCDLCGKILHSDNFHKHMRKHSIVANEKVECHICNSLLGKKYIKTHLKNHEEANMDHVCPTCGKNSPNRKALYKHIYEVHRLKKSHPCTVCKKSFKSKDLLTQHLPVHTGENNFKCSFCSRLFKFKSNLCDHKKKEHYEEFEEEKRNRRKRLVKESNTRTVDSTYSIRFYHRLLKMSCCFMCLEKPDKTLNVFSDEFKFSPLEVINKYFWFTPTPDNPLICLNCWKATEDFHKFYLKVKEVHENIAVKSEISDSIGIINDEKSNTGANLLLFNSSEISCNVSNDDGSLSLKSEILNDSTGDILGNEKNELSAPKDESFCLKHEENKKVKVRKNVSRQNKKIKHISINKAEEYEGYDQKISSFMTLNCVLCSSALPTFGKLKTHFKNDHNTNGYAVCCSKKFYKKSLLVDHIDVHINPEHFKCSICSKTFKNKRAYKDHVDIYHDLAKVKYTCDICTKEFFSNKKLTAHQKTHRPKEEWKFKCNYVDCDKIYPNREKLNSHIHRVHKIKIKVCDSCGKILNSDHFHEHMRKHSDVGNKKVECHICNLFFDKKYIKTHIKNHEEANMDHICPTCGKKSPNRRALYKHVYTVHRLTKSHPCTVCKKSFKSKELLTQHMPVHTGENNFKCPFCDRLFKFNSNLADHKRKEHFEEFEEEKRNRRKRLNTENKTILNT